MFVELWFYIILGLAVVLSILHHVSCMNVVCLYDYVL